MTRRMKTARAKSMTHAPKRIGSPGSPKRPRGPSLAGYCRRLYEIPRIGRLYQIDEE